MRKLKIGVIGAGGIARRRTIPGMIKAKNCELTAVMDVAGIDKIAAEFGVKGYTAEKELLADPNVEAVYIASPVFLHLDQIKAAAKAGKHILCEKPLTLTVKETEKAVETCAKHNVFLQEGYMMKFHGAHTKIKELVDSGKLGKIVYMRAQLSCWYPPIPGAWRQNPEKGGGGSLIDMATHLYDLLEYFAGPLKKIGALTSSLVQDYKSEDSSTSLIEFKSGAHATVDAFFCVPDEASKTRLEIYGSKGALLTEGTIGQSSAGKMEGIFGLGEGGYDASQSKDVVREFRPVEFAGVNPYTAECEYFADCVLSGKAPKINSPENAINIMRVTELAYKSAAKGRIYEL